MVGDGVKERKLQYFVTLFLFLLFVFGNGLVNAKGYSISGRVLDAQTHEGLPFVNIVFNDSHQGTITSMDGYFNISSDMKLEYLRFSSVGYQEQRFSVDSIKDKGFVRVYLNASMEKLEEVKVVPGDNPAHRIIDKLVANRNLNNPEKLPAFSYLAYHKMNLSIDKIKQNGKLSQIQEKELKDLMKKHYLFFLETVSQKKFLAPQYSKEKVLISRVSGYKNPEFALLATQLQSFSFYGDFVALGDVRYLSPVSPGSTRKYLFVLEDTLFDRQKDSVFVISFRPRKGTNFKGLKGYVHVNSRGYALQNVVAEPAQYEKGVNIKVQQKYEFVDGKKWFPVQLNTQIRMEGLALNGPGRSLALKGEGRSYLMNIDLNPKFEKREFDEVQLEIDSQAYKAPAQSMEKYRQGQLTNKEKETYRVLDSIGRVHNLDRKLDSYMALMWGKIPMGVVDLQLNRILGFDSHQGFRLGMGVTTNQRLLKWMNLGGYFAYGFKDRKWKYGAQVQLHPLKEKSNYLNLYYSDDVMETGGSSFLNDKDPYSSESFREFMLRQMDNNKLIRVGVGARPFSFLQMEIYLLHRKVQSLGSYAFKLDDGEVNSYRFTEAGVQMRFAYREKFMKTQKHKISLGTEYPMVWLNVARGMDKFRGDYPYTRMEIKVKSHFITRAFGKSIFTLTGGSVDGNLPVSALFNNRPAFNKQEPIAVDNSFNAMRMNEFASNKYVALFFKQDFGSLLFSTRSFKPELALVHHMGWGELDHKEEHLYLPVNSMEKGFFESGVQVHSLLKNFLFKFGVGLYYRYGPYAFDSASDNLSVKMTLGFSF